jgi:hypothetical protein
LDTREKIVTLAEFAARDRQGLWTAVIGVFDPFTLAVAKAIRERAKVDRDLLVVVAPANGTLLNPEARAALIAALRDVDTVVIAAAEEARSSLKNIPGIEIFEDPAADTRRSREFVDLVLARQASSAQ